MSAEWVTAIATVGTFVVIAASAGAALFQLRHMRSSNQIVALTEIRETLESPEFLAAMKYVHYEFPGLLHDPDVRMRLIAPGPMANEFVAVRTVCGFFEQFGAFVKRGIIDAELVCDLYGPPVLTNWEIVAPFIANRRAALNFPSLYENFEYFAVLSKGWSERYPDGSYPARAARMPLPELWPETRRA